MQFQVDAKKRISAVKKRLVGTGGGPEGTELSDIDKKKCGHNWGIQCFWYPRGDTGKLEEGKCFIK